MDTIQGIKKLQISFFFISVYIIYPILLYKLYISSDIKNLDDKAYTILDLYKKNLSTKNFTYKEFVSLKTDLLEKKISNDILDMPSRYNIHIANTFLLVNSILFFLLLNKLIDLISENLAQLNNLKKYIIIGLIILIFTLLLEFTEEDYTTMFMKASLSSEEWKNIRLKQRQRQEKEKLNTPEVIIPVPSPVPNVLLLAPPPSTSPTQPIVETSLQDSENNEENQQKEETNKSGWFNFWPFK